MDKLMVADKGRCDKLPPVHYEKFLRFMRQMSNMDLVQEAKRMSLIEGSSFLSDSTLDEYLQTHLPRLYALSSSAEVSIRSEYYAMRSAVAHAMAFSVSRKVFRLERGLTQKLACTAVSKLDARYVRSPFESIYLSLPHNEDVLMPNMQDGEHLVTGCYLFCRKVDATSLKVRTKTDTGTSLVTASDKFGADELYLVKLLAVSENGGSRDVWDLSKDYLFYGMFFLRDGEDLLKQVATQAVENCLVARDVPYMEALMRFVVNSLLYLSSPSAALESVRPKLATLSSKKASDKERAKVATKNEDLSRLGIISVGAGVSCLSRADDFYSSTPVGHRVVCCPSWRVRGHWRAQPYGAGRAQRRALWIEPYDKGKGILGEDTPEERVYKVR